MLTQRTELAKQLPQHGWRILNVEDSSLEWWADEIWLIESLWTPKGFGLYLTFLVDPMAAPERVKGRQPVFDKMPLAVGQVSGVALV